jgi:glycosyltransferase involved in cell wall biosynthesis
MKISIVIRAHNEAKHIGKLMVGIAAQQLQPHEVIVVDSGSTDGTAAIAARHGARVIGITKHDFTFGRALNLGCAAATGDILVFASAHVYPTYDDWLSTLVAPFENERVVLSYGRQRGNEVNKFSEHRVFEKWFPIESMIPQASYFCNNANCAVRRSAWLDQPYDESLTGLEDLAWAKQARDRGGWLAYAAQSEIIHVHEESWAQVQNRYRREAIAMRHIDKHAHFNLTDFIRLFLVNAIADGRVALAQGVFRKELGSILRFRFNQFWGTYKGYHGSPEITAQLRQRFYFPLSPEERSQLEEARDRHRIDYAQITQDGEERPAKVVRIK